jgi:hypothetical protein
MSRRIELAVPAERPTKAGWYWFDGTIFGGRASLPVRVLSDGAFVVEGLVIEPVAPVEIAGTWRWLGEGR